MDYALTVARLEAALARNTLCSSGLVARGRAFAIDAGPSLGPEALALVHADDLHGERFWYGHVARHPHTAGVYVSMLVWIGRFVNASTVPLLFRRFRHWTVADPHYEPCTVQGDGDAYAESTTFQSGVGALVEMIDRFDLARRTGCEGDGHDRDPLEMRIVGVLGLLGLRDGDGRRPLIPATAPLRLVEPSS